jgi:hypothetical protein
MSLSRRLVLGSSAVVLAAGLAGCGGTSAPPTSAPTSEAPATTAAPSPSPTPTGVIELTADTFVGALTKGQASLSAMSARFEMEVASAGATMTATGAVRATAGATPEMAMTMTVPGQATAIEMRMVGGIFYMNMGEATGGKYVAVNPSDPSVGVPMPTDVDPASSAKDLEGAIVSVTKVGQPAQVGGVLTQAFDVVVDLAKVTGTTRQTLDQALKQASPAGATLPPTMTYHYWIDAAGLVHRVAYDALGTSTQMTFEGWGEPVDITAPTADQIANLDKS